MASERYIESLLGSLPADFKRALIPVFSEILTNFRLGHPDDQRRAENLQAYYYRAVTPATPGQEFSIPHGLLKTPYNLVPVLPLEVGYRLVPLTVTRAPDAARVYLSSTVASAPICILLEA